MKTLNLITVYDRPLDFPDSYVARRFEMNKATTDIFAHKDLVAVRQWCRSRLILAGQDYPMRMPRDNSDDRVILETWI